MVKKVNITCNACGKDEFHKLSTVGEWTIGKCGNCELIYLNPIPFFEPSMDFSEVSKDFQYTQFQHQPITPEIIQFDKEQLQQNMAEVSAITGRSFDSIRMLDIGCGSGASVRAATELGWEATGIDIDLELINEGREQLDVDLRCVTLLEADLPDNHYHFIRLRDVIEHLPNPYEVLTEIKRLLVPGGVVLISTPNEGSLLGQIRMTLRGKRDTVAAVRPPHHMHGFKPKSLKCILKRAGLKSYMLKTTTPIDPNYSTSNQMRGKNRPLFVASWRTANFFGRGSMLIGWAGKE